MTLAWFISDMIIVKSLHSIFFDFGIPNTISESIHKLADNLMDIITFFFNEENNYLNINNNFSAPDYLFVSNVIAKEMPELIESKVILSYKSPLPGLICKKWSGKVTQEENDYYQQEKEKENNIKNQNSFSNALLKFSRMNESTQSIIHKSIEISSVSLADFVFIIIFKQITIILAIYGYYIIFGSIVGGIVFIYLLNKLANRYLCNTNTIEVEGNNLNSISFVDQPNNNNSINQQNPTIVNNAPTDEYGETYVISSSNSSTLSNSSRNIDQFILSDNSTNSISNEEDDEDVIKNLTVSSNQDLVADASIVDSKTVNDAKNDNIATDSKGKYSENQEEEEEEEEELYDYYEKKIDLENYSSNSSEEEEDYSIF
jgi:hypothetical protein